VRDPSVPFFALRREKRLSISDVPRVLGCALRSAYKWDLGKEEPPAAIMAALQALPVQPAQRIRSDDTSREKGSALLQEAMANAKVRAGLLAEAVGYSRQRLHQLKVSCPEDKARQLIAVWEEKGLIHAPE